MHLQNFYCQQQIWYDEIEKIAYNVLEITSNHLKSVSHTESFRI